MTKRRKTRQQKIIAELRRKVQSAETTSQHMGQQFTPPPQNYTYKLSTMNASVITHQQSSYIQSYAYLPLELRKTTLITGSLILAQCFLYFLLRVHIVSLPFASY